MRLTVVSTMKNEGPFLLEWLAHHLVLGFTDFVVCHNDCEDGTDAMLDRLAALGLVTAHRTRSRGGGIHRSALRQARCYPAVTGAEWVYVCDADEFLNVHVGQHHVADLIAAAGDDADVISVPWRIFGNSGVEALSDRPVTRQFIRCEDAAARDAGHFVKSLTRGQHRFRRLGLHGPVPAEGEADNFVFRRVGGGERGTPRPFEVAQVNHYPLRSRDSFLVKRARGRANHMHHVIGADYWNRWNRQGATDRSILRYAAATDDRIADLLTDADLARLHAAAIDWHRRRAAAMRADPALAPLIAAIGGQARPGPTAPRDVPPTAHRR